MTPPDELKKAEEIYERNKGLEFGRVVTEEITKALRRQAIETLERPGVKALVEYIEIQKCLCPEIKLMAGEKALCSRCISLFLFTKLKSDLETKGE